MTENEKQEIRKNLPKWTEEFVQKEWYREFLQNYPLNEFPSLLEIDPFVSIMTENYRTKYNLADVLENHVDFISHLRHDILHLYYKDFGDVIKVLRQKYGEIVVEDLNYLTIFAKWFGKNAEANVELDKKYNSDLTHW